MITVAGAATRLTALVVFALVVAGLTDSAALGVIALFVVVGPVADRLSDSAPVQWAGVLATAAILLWIALFAMLKVFH